MYKRLCNLSQSHSYFLFGARGTGKSTLLNQFYSDLKSQTLWIDLLEPEMEQTLSMTPSKLTEMINAQENPVTCVVLDEIQKIPKLLDVVHSLIEKKKICFALTGSSARKLKRGQANLLAGRAFQFKLFPLTFMELGNDFNLEKVLQWGSLPEIFHLKSDADRQRFLQAYTQTYLKEEILVEQIIRKIQPFRAFLEVAAQSNGDIINFSKIGRQAGLDPKSVERYFDILNDTLLGFYLEPYSKSIRKRQSQHPKFYFFDTGVVRALTRELDVKLKPQTYAFGKAFEHLVVLEIFRLNEYFEKDFKISYLRTKNNLEIDLILEKPSVIILIEIKSSQQIVQDHLTSLRSLSHEFPNAKKFVLCLEPRPRLVDGIKIIHWQEGLKEILALAA